MICRSASFFCRSAKSTGISVKPNVASPKSGIHGLKTVWAGMLAVSPESHKDKSYSQQHRIAFRIGVRREYQICGTINELAQRPTVVLNASFCLNFAGGSARCLLTSLFDQGRSTSRTPFQAGGRNRTSNGDWSVSVNGSSDRSDGECLILNHQTFDRLPTERHSVGRVSSGICFRSIIGRRRGEVCG